MSLLAVSYHLSINQSNLSKPGHQLGNKYKSMNEITGNALMSRSYFNVVVEEGLRVYSPAGARPSRIVPSRQRGEGLETSLLSSCGLEGHLGRECASFSPRSSALLPDNEIDRELNNKGHKLGRSMA